MISFVEINTQALRKNIATFRQLIGQERVLAAVVKGNAYGHGIVECAKVFQKEAVDYFCVNSLEEAKILRSNQVDTPILIQGYIPLASLKEAASLDVDILAYNQSTIRQLGELGRPVSIHLKLETGIHRQGVLPEDLEDVLQLISSFEKLSLVGVSTHFADVEDSSQHKYAIKQLERFNKAIDIIKSHGIKPKYLHCANTAASILMPESRFNFVRIGIGCYGLWPSEKVKQATVEKGSSLELSPALIWKTMVAQVKEVKKGGLIGYGCTYKMPEDGKIAVIPVGYYDGFDRLLSNRGCVLIHGKRARVVGRVAMNMIVIDVSKIKGVKEEDEVVLIGRQGEGRITAEEMASLSETINYEVTTRINKAIPRITISQ